MTVGSDVTAARFRGAVAGALTVVLAVLAHSWSGADVPAGASTALLGVVAVGIGTLVAVTSGRVPGLLATLAVGQALGHLVLGGHGHAAAVPGPVMFIAHAAAVVACAALLAVASGLVAALRRAVRALVTIAVPVDADPRHGTARPSAGPARSWFVFATSISHRGPPVGVS